MWPEWVCTLCILVGSIADHTAWCVCSHTFLYYCFLFDELVVACCCPHSIRGSNMNFAPVFLVVVMLAVDAVAASPSDALPAAVIMPWFCTQRCGFNVTQIVEHVHQAAELAAGPVPILNTVAFERYNLGPNSSLIFNPNLFDVNHYIQQNSELSSLFPRRIAMVSSFPYPPQFLDWMRQLFDDPSPFMDAIMHELKAHDLYGLNIDFEPTSSNATNEDAARYATFLDLLRTRLATEGKILTVAGATWSPIWNLTLIAQALSSNNTTSSLIGYFTSMNTYTFEDSVFASELNANIEVFQAYGTEKSLVVGLETWPQNFTAAELTFHFNALRDRNICRIAIWDMPLPSAMVPHLINVSKRCAA